MRTAEFITPNNSDKLCDIVSDTLYDYFKSIDSQTNCVLETLYNNKSLNINGFLKINKSILLQDIKNFIKDKFDIENINININFLDNQINFKNTGITLGYACSETFSMMPFEYELVRGLTRFIYDHYPTDGIVQITINGTDIKVICSFENSNTTHIDELIRYFFKNKIDELLVSPMKFNIAEKVYNQNNFYNKIGMSGKRNVIDNYGPRIPIGGNSYSGKDYFNTNRIGGYMARKIAVDSVKKYNLRYALVELSFASESGFPIQAALKGNEHGINTETGLFVKQVTEYELHPNNIISFLDLSKQNYSETSKWGHFGNNFSWDKN